MPELWAIRVSALDPAGHPKTGAKVAQDVAGPCCFAGDIIASRTCESRHLTPDEAFRLIAEIAMGAGTLAMIGGTVVIVGFLTLAAGGTLAIQGYSSLGNIGIEALTGFLAAFINVRISAPVVAGIFYTLLGLAGGAVVGLLAAFPKELVAAVAGLALLGTIAGGLAQAPVEGAGLQPQALGLVEQGTVAAEIEAHREKRQGDAGNAHRPQGTKAPPCRLAQARNAVRPPQAGSQAHGPASQRAAS